MPLKLQELEYSPKKYILSPEYRVYKTLQVFLKIKFIALNCAKHELPLVTKYQLYNKRIVDLYVYVLFRLFYCCRNLITLVCVFAFKFLFSTAFYVN